VDRVSLQVAFNGQSTSRADERRALSFKVWPQPVGEMRKGGREGGICE